MSLIDSESIRRVTPFFEQADAEDIAFRRSAIDNAIAENRTRTPAHVAEQRTAPRLSIAEINAMDMEQLSEQFARTHREGRGPVEQVLDWIDLPRNAIANIVTGIAMPSVRQTDETGALDLPVVTTSDVLRHLGVENKVARGIIGFVGDVALDPLTYVGAPGGGTAAWAVTKGGSVASVALRRGGKKALFGSIDDVSKGLAARDLAAGEVLNKLGWTTDRVNELKAAGKTEKAITQEIRKELIGDPGVDLSQFVNKPDAMKENYLGSRLAYELERGTGDASDAVRKFTAQYAAGTEPGLRLGVKPGEVGSAIASIPFTDYALTVPSIFGGNAAKRRMLWLSQAKNTGLTEEATRDTLAAEAYFSSKRVNDLYNEQAIDLEKEIADKSASSVRLKELGEVEPLPREPAQFNLMDEGVAEVPGYDPIVVEQERRASARAAYEERTAARLAEARAETKKLRDSLAAARLDPVKGQSPEYMIQLANAYDTALVSERRAEVIANQHRAMENFADLKAAEMDHLGRHAPDSMVRLWRESPEDAKQLSELATASFETATASANQVKGQLVSYLTSGEQAMMDHAKAMLSIDDTAVIASLFARVGTGLESVAGQDNKVSRRLRTIDSWWRTTFNQRGGYQLDAIARGNFERRGSKILEDHIQHQFQREMGEIAAKHGVKSTDALNQLAYAKMYEKADPGSAVYHWWKFSPDGPEAGGPSGLAVLLRESEQTGLLANKQLLKDVEEVAERTVKAHNVLGDKELADNMLGQLMVGNVPLKVADQANLDIIERRMKIGERGKGGGGLQPFQKRRTTYQTRYLDPATGKWARFFEMDRWLMGDADKIRQGDTVLPLDQIARNFGTDMDKAKVYAEALEAMTRYDQLASESADFAKAYFARPTDHVELNEMWQRGRFEALTGGSKVSADFFEKSLPQVIGARMAQHQRAEGSMRHVLMLKRVGIQLDPTHIANHVNEYKTRTAIGTNKGVTYKIISSDSDKVVFDIGGQRYRLLLPDTRKNYGNIWGRYYGAKETDLDGLAIPEVIADKMDAVAAIHTPENIPKILGALDSGTSLWRKLTLFHPSWIIRDMIGNFSNAIAGGVKIEHLMKDAEKTLGMLMLKSAPHMARKYVFDLPSGQVTGDELLRMLFQDTIAEHNLPLEVMSKIAVENPGLFSKPDAFFGKVAGPYFRANGLANDWIRTQAYLSFLRQGYDRSTARMMTLRSMMDWADFTRVEREYFRRLVPFYSWMRNNMGYQLWQIVNSPAYLATIPDLHNAMEEMLAGDERVPEHDRPGWMREQLAMQLVSDPNKRFGVMFNSFMPAQDAFNLLAPLTGTEGAMKLLHYFGSSLNPVLSVPLQLGSKTEFFTGRRIGATDAEGDISAGDFLAQQIRPLSEFGVGGVAGAVAGGLGGAAVGGPVGGLVGGLGGAIAGSGLTQTGKVGRSLARSPGEFASRALVGGGLQAMDDARLSMGLQREFREEETRLRAAIGRAERAGDKQTSLDARARLLSMYEDMQGRGLKIPVWAQNQLRELSEPLTR